MNDFVPWWKVWLQIAVVSVVLLRWTLRDDPVGRILRLFILAQIAYGIAQDQINARLSPEYFLVVHSPKLEGVTDPTLLALLWGFLGSWWGGLLIGLGVVLSGTLGPAPPITERRLHRPLACVLLFQAFVTALCGFAAWQIHGILGLSMPDGLASLVPEARRGALVAVAASHIGTYLSAVAGAVVLCVWVALNRPAPQVAPAAAWCQPTAFPHEVAG